MGEAFRRHGSKMTEVSIILPDGTGVEIITRTRSNSKNSYRYEGGNGPTTEFDKVSKDVPIEITDALNLDDINVQAQMDAPFLLSESSAEVARILNRAAGMQDIDATMSAINSMQHENSRELNTRKTDLEGVEKEVLRFAGLDELDGRVGAAEMIEGKMRAAWNVVGNITGDLEALEIVDEHLRGVKPEAALDIGAAEKLFTEFKAADNTVWELKSLLETLGEITVAEEKLQQVTTHNDALQEADALVIKHREAAERHNAVRKLLTDLDSCDEEIEDLGQKLNALDAEFQELMPDECPLCERNCDCG